MFVGVKRHILGNESPEFDTVFGGDYKFLSEIFGNIITCRCYDKTDVSSVDAIIVDFEA